MTQDKAEQDIEVFVIGVTKPFGYANMPVVCEECNVGYYTDPKNLRLAVDKKMRIICMRCMSKMAEAGEEMELAGLVNSGQIIHRPAND